MRWKLEVKNNRTKKFAQICTTTARLSGKPPRPNALGRAVFSLQTACDVILMDVTLVGYGAMRSPARQDEEEQIF